MTWLDERNAPPWEPGAIWLGRARRQWTGPAIGHRDDRHCLTLCSSRGGKGVSSIVPALLTWPGSVVCIDPKGENAEITARVRADQLGQAVAVLDPFGVANVREDLRASFNPLDAINENDDMAPSQVRKLAEALITEAKEDHWIRSARNFFAGLVLHVCDKARPEERNLVTVREFLTMGGETFEGVLLAMEESDLAMVREAATSLKDKPPGERGSVLSTAREQTAILSDPPIVRALQSSGFKLADLKHSERGLSLYLCIPGDEMDTYSGWLRMLIKQTLKAHSGDDAPATGHQTLFVLDEFHLLGHMEEISQSAALMAGQGVKLWPFVQDLTVLKDNYPQAWETFFANAGIIQAFSVGDMTLARYLSDHFGEHEIERKSRSVSHSAQPHSSSDRGDRSSETLSTSHQFRPVITAVEIKDDFERETMRQLVLIRGKGRVKLWRTPYYDDPAFPDWDPPAGKPGPRSADEWSTELKKRRKETRFSGMFEALEGEPVLAGAILFVLIVVGYGAVWGF